MAKGPMHLEVKVKVDKTKTTQELNEQIINKFLKKTSKENLLKFLVEKSKFTRRFIKKSVKNRQKKLKAERTARLNNQEKLEPDKKK